MSASYSVFCQTRLKTPKSTSYSVFARHRQSVFRDVGDLCLPEIQARLQTPGSASYSVFARDIDETFRRQDLHHVLYLPETQTRRSDVKIYIMFCICQRHRRDVQTSRSTSCSVFARDMDDLCLPRHRRYFKRQGLHHLPYFPETTTICILLEA